jgi:transcriptional regulator with XRE-family HTH domain
MRIIDRLKIYLDSREISPRRFERTCGLSNGYFNKQLRGKGAMGSDILEKIHAAYEDLSLIWLITGRGSMLLKYTNQQVQEEAEQYSGVKDELIYVLREQLAVLRSACADKDKIITLLEKQLGRQPLQAPRTGRAGTSRKEGPPGLITDIWP